MLRIRQNQGMRCFHNASHNPRKDCQAAWLAFLKKAYDIAQNLSPYPIKESIEVSASEHSLVTTKIWREKKESEEALTEAFRALIQAFESHESRGH